MTVPPTIAAAVRRRQSVIARDARPLGERLQSAGLIGADELEAALNEQRVHNTKLGETLIGLGFVSEDDLLPFLGDHLKTPAVRLRDGLVDPAVIRCIPRPKAEQFDAVALFRVRGTLTVAMADPGNLQQCDDLERLTGYRVRPVFALRSDIRRMIQRGYEDGFEVDAVTADHNEDAIQIERETISLDLKDIESLADGSPIINLVNFIVIQAIRQKASDIHIEPGPKNTTVRYRIDGSLREVLRPRREFHAALVSRVKVMAKLDIAEQRNPQDGRIHVVADGHEIDIRVSTLPTVRGEKAVLRILDRRNLSFDLDKLGVPETMLGHVKTMLGRPHGLLLVTGPTGSGKTTTLYSALELIKSVHHNIVTVEDPVEYQLDLINQVQVKTSPTLTFANALRSILRQDPDVIMVGEIRDAETAEIAIQAALTGHLVLSTLHTNDSCSAVTRLTDMGIAPYKIAAALGGVIAQRLIRGVCSSCRTQYYPPEEILNLINYQGDRRRQFVKGNGCRECHDTGLKGRRGIYEVLVCGREVRDVICKDPNVDTLRNLHKQLGGRTLMDEGIRVAEAGYTSLEEVVRTAFVE